MLEGDVRRFCLCKTWFLSFAPQNLGQSIAPFGLAFAMQNLETKKKEFFFCHNFFYIFFIHRIFIYFSFIEFLYFL